jgi:hypothetical protein
MKILYDNFSEVADEYCRQMGLEVSFLSLCVKQKADEETIRGYNHAQGVTRFADFLDAIGIKMEPVEKNCLVKVGKQVASAYYTEAEWRKERRAKCGGESSAG